jgi:hypothetical protein
VPDEKPTNAQLAGQTVQQIADAQGKHVIDALLDILVEDEFSLRPRGERRLKAGFVKHNGGRRQIRERRLRSEGFRCRLDLRRRLGRADLRSRNLRFQRGRRGRSCARDAHVAAVR